VGDGGVPNLHRRTCSRRDGEAISAHTPRVPADLPSRDHPHGRRALHLRQVPLGFWLQRTFNFSRNHYDRIGHLAQGFVPAIVAREVLLRRSPLQRGNWLFFLVTCVCLAISACYEFIQWAAGEIGASRADAFLGTQGDVWDTQWDMLIALIGAIAAQLLLARRHDRELASLS
jgi:putative membrane protein